MAYASQGTAPLFGTSATVASPITFTIYNQSNTSLGSGYVMPTVTGWNVTHQADNIKTKDSHGNIQSTTGHGEYLECQFDLVPDGTSLANSRLASTLPPIMSTVVISGADVFPSGPFADAINVAGGSAPETSRWIYEGGGSVRQSNDGHAVVSITLRRYPNIVGGTAIVA